MLVIWRRHGWLVLAFFLIAWALADGPVAALFRQVTNDKWLYNPEKAICWGISLLLSALLMFGFNLLALRSEGKQLTQEEFQQAKDKQLAAYRYYPLIDDAPDAAAVHRAAFEANLAAVPLPAPVAKSSFFFIPMKFVPIGFAVIGVLLIVANISAAQAGT